MNMFAIRRNENGSRIESTNLYWIPEAVELRSWNNLSTIQRCSRIDPTINHWPSQWCDAHLGYNSFIMNHRMKFICILKKTNDRKRLSVWQMHLWSHGLFRANVWVSFRFEWLGSTFAFEQCNSRERATGSHRFHPWGEPVPVNRWNGEHFEWTVDEIHPKISRAPSKHENISQSPIPPSSEWFIKLESVIA